jgi:hypothetical protein
MKSEIPVHKEAKAYSETILYHYGYFIIDSGKNQQGINAVGNGGVNYPDNIK